MTGSILGSWCKWVNVFEHIIVLGLEMNHLCFFSFFAHEWLPFCNWTGFVASRVRGVVVGTVVKWVRESEWSEWVKTRRSIIVSFHEQVYQYNFTKGGKTCVYLFGNWHSINVILWADKLDVHRKSTQDYTLWQHKTILPWKTTLLQGKGRGC